MERPTEERATIHSGRFFAQGAEKRAREREGTSERRGEGERATERKRRGGQTSLEKERSLRGKYTSLQKAGGEGETSERRVGAERKYQRGQGENSREEHTGSTNGFEKEDYSWSIKRGEFEGRSEASRGGARRGTETERPSWSGEGASGSRAASSRAGETREGKTLAAAKRSRATPESEKTRARRHSESSESTRGESSSLSEERHYGNCTTRQRTVLDEINKPGRPPGRCFEGFFEDYPVHVSERTGECKAVSKHGVQAVSVENCNVTDSNPVIVDASENSADRDDVTTDDLYRHLEPILNDLPSELSREQHELISEVLKKHHLAFSKHEFDLGRANCLEAVIDISEDRPRPEPMRRYARIYREAVDEQTRQMIKADIIEEASSRFNSNLVIVKKRDSDKVRVTVDLRKLNAVCYLDRYPLPKIRDIFECLEGNVWFTSMDISNSFYQVPLKESDRDFTAFSTRLGQFRFKRMPQGFLNSSSIFSRLMNMIMRGLTFTAVLCYIDDIVVMGKTFEEHLKNLDSVLERIERANLKLKPEKCKMFRHEIKLLGHKVSSEGITALPERTDAISVLDFPETVTQMRSFLGMCNYYRYYCPDFSIIAAPLYDMTKKDAMPEPTEEALEAFEKLKVFLTTAPVLALPNDDGMYVVDTDASHAGCGAVLQQFDREGNLHVIEYASRTFNGAERRYCVTRKEMAAIIFALKHFRVYLTGQVFKIRVDHSALTHLETVNDPSGQQLRQLDFMSRFHFDIEYRPGKYHVNADFMSRRTPCEALGPDTPCAQCNRRVKAKCTSKLKNSLATEKREKKKCGTDTVAQGSRVCSVESKKLMRHLSRTMCYLLRHGAVKQRLKMDSAGYVAVNEVLRNKHLRTYSVEDVKIVVRSDPKERFTLKEEDDVLKICANQGHTIDVDELQLRRVNDPQELTGVFHGTYMRCVHAIEAEGISRMGRKFIHFTTDELEERRNIPRGHEVDIYINVPKAMRDGFEFFVAQNGVVLCRGNETGCIPDKYFTHVVKRAMDDINAIAQIADRPQRQKCRSRFRRDRPVVQQQKSDEETVLPVISEEEERIDGDQHDRNSSDRDSTSETGAPNITTVPLKRKKNKTSQGARIPDPPEELERLSMESIARCQKEDVDIAPVLVWVENNKLPSWSEVKPSSAFTRALYRQFSSLRMSDGVLHRRIEDTRGDEVCDQFIMPRALRAVFLEAVHCDIAAHLMFDKCVELVQKKAWWLNWRDDLHLYIQACSKCASYSRGKPPHQAPLKPILIGGPFLRWALDLTGPHVMSNGYTYIFTALDMFSKFLIAIPIRDKSAETVTRAFVDNVVLRFGICQEVLTDQGPEFMAGITQELLNILGVSSIRTTPYQPSTNGAVERSHRTLNSIIAKCVSDTQRDWSYYLPYLTLAYNSTPHRSTGFSPFYVYHGRDPLWRIDLILGTPNIPQLSVHQYTQQMVDKLYYAEQLVREKLETCGRNMSSWYDRKVKSKEFEVGDRVYVYNPRRYLHRSPKWQRQYAMEAIIMRKINDVNYVVKPKKGPEYIIHVDKIKPCVEFEPESDP